MCSKNEAGFWFHFEKHRIWRFRYFYAHENKTLLDRFKPVCTRDDLAKLKVFLNKTDVLESCRQKRMNAKWRFYKLTNLTLFAALLKIVPIGCKNAVFSEPLLKNHTFNCLTLEENTRQPHNDNLCPFCALALHFLGNQQPEEETSKLFIFFINNKTDRLSADQYQGFHLNEIPIVEDVLIFNILLYDIDIEDGNIIGELARQIVHKYINTVRLLRYNSHIWNVSNINVVFQSFRCPNHDTFFSRTFNLERHLTNWCERVKKRLSADRISNPKNSLWQAGLFRYQIHTLTKIFQKFCTFWFRINLCLRKVLQRYNDNNVDRKACTDFSILFFKPCKRT